MPPVQSLKDVGNVRENLNALRQGQRNFAAMVATSHLAALCELEMPQKEQS
jgi:hypothetical protein